MISIRLATIKDLDSVIDLANELFELERINWDKYMIPNYPRTKEGKMFIKNTILTDTVFVAEDTLWGGNCISFKQTNADILL